MKGDSQAFSIAAIVALVLLAAFLAMAETSLTRMNRVRAMSLEEEERRGASRLVRLVNHPERWLTPVLLLLLACHLVAAAFVESQDSADGDAGRSGNTLQLHVARTSHARRRHPIFPLRISALPIPRAHRPPAVHRRLRS